MKKVPMDKGAESMWDPALLLEMHRRMLRIRHFDEAVKKLAARGEMPGSLHTSIGQEAEVVGACMALRPDDYMTGNHRSHGHPIGKGSPLGPLMAELFGKRTGVCRGKGGSMHLADFKVGSLGESGVVGSGVPVATGAALSSQRLRNGRIALSFFGDGGGNQGVLFESMNMAAIWHLPMLFLCENNQYQAQTAARDVTAGPHIASRAAGFGLPGIFVEDGQDVLAVYEVVLEAAERARIGDGPTLIEVLTYRFGDHSEGIRHAASTRDPAEVERWRNRDPISSFRERLIRDAVATPQRLDELEREVQAEVDAAIVFARESPFPDFSEAFLDVYADGPQES